MTKKILNTDEASQFAYLTGNRMFEVNAHLHTATCYSKLNVHYIVVDIYDCIITDKK